MPRPTWRCTAPSGWAAIASNGRTTRTRRREPRRMRPMESAAPMFEPTPEPTPRPSSSAPQLRTLLLTDLVDSTALVERLGDGPASDLFRAHDRLVLQLQQQWRGRLIDRSDG